jgi:NAD-dependent DNA ligase
VDNTKPELHNEFQPIETITVDESNPLYQKHIVMTKVRDAEIIAHLKSVGGILDNNISKQTYILIVKSLDDVSNKMKKANEDKIPIMTPEMFKEKYMK